MSGCRTSNLANSMTTIFPMPYGRISPFPSVLRSNSTISISSVSPFTPSNGKCFLPASIPYHTYLPKTRQLAACVFDVPYKNAPISYDLNLGDDVCGICLPVTLVAGALYSPIALSAFGRLFAPS